MNNQRFEIYTVRYSMSLQKKKKHKLDVSKRNLVFWTRIVCLAAQQWINVWLLSGSQWGWRNPFEKKPYLIGGEAYQKKIPRKTNLPLIFGDVQQREALLGCNWDTLWHILKKAIIILCFMTCSIFLLLSQLLTRLKCIGVLSIIKRKAIFVKIQPHSKVGRARISWFCLLYTENIWV